MAYQHHIKRPRHGKLVPIRFDCPAYLKKEFGDYCKKKKMQIRIGLQEAMLLLMDHSAEYDVCPDCERIQDRPFCKIGDNNERD